MRIYDEQILQELDSIGVKIMNQTEDYIMLECKRGLSLEQTQLVDSLLGASFCCIAPPTNITISVWRKYK